jgi:hypothetical protein
MVKAPFLVVALLLMALPWLAWGAVAGVARWAAPGKMRGMAQLVRARRALHRQRHRARHAREGAAEARKFESVRSERSSTARRSHPVQAEASSDGSAHLK